MARILIVDDASYFRIRLRSMLESMGHQVVGEASNGEQAPVSYMRYKPDIVTMDINMPLANGIEGVKNIISKDPRAKIIMVSTKGQKACVLEAMKFGAKHFVLKPFEKSVLHEVITKVSEID